MTKFDLDKVKVFKKKVEMLSELMKNDEQT
jgi:hypothetical protein